MVQKLLSVCLSFCLFCKAVKSKVQRTAAVRVVLYAYGTEIHRTAAVRVVLYAYGTEVHRTAAVPVVLYAYGTRCLAFREEHKLRVIREEYTWV